jgi:TRAP-type C4-dicarboxylate transport system permease small subunit
MLGILDHLIARVAMLARYGAWFGGALILLAAIVVCADVAMRALFNKSLGGADELSGFALAIGTAWALGFALMERAHVRIDSLYTLLPGPARACLDILGLTVFGLFLTMMAWQGTGVMLQSVANSTVTLSAVAWPLRYPQFLWVAGLWWFVLIALLLWLRAVLTLARGRFLAVQHQIGSKTVQEEVGEELAKLEELEAARSGKDGDP